MVSPRPSCISWPVSRMAAPPSWRMATSKETRVRVDGLSKIDRKSTRLNSSHLVISYAVFCLNTQTVTTRRIEIGSCDFGHLPPDLTHLLPLAAYHAPGLY